ncbi:MAG: GDP-L-fucose synthase [Candidatus Omnitrophica bacterium]|nr:GDP-L-fucose synthase [Candidatus Omnitrophota bacterium]
MKNKNAKIYIAGHKGLVGSALARKLEGDGYSNLVFRDSNQLDLRRQTDVEKFFEEEKPEYVFLAAAKAGGIFANYNYKAEFIYDNVMIATNVIHSAYKAGVKKLINLGSSCIYPRLAPQPLKEEYLLTAKLESTNEPYAVAKITAIKLCRYYCEQYKTNFISVMPANLYGPGDKFDLEKAHVLPALMRKFHLAKLLFEGKYDKVCEDLKEYGNMPMLGEEQASNLTGRQIIDHLAKFGITKDSVILWGTGDSSRELLYVDDLADACIFLMKQYDVNELGELINIGTGVDLKIKEIADLIKDLVGFNGEICYDNSKPDGTPRKLLEVSKLNSLGWRAKTNLEKGMIETYNYYVRRKGAS